MSTNCSNEYMDHDGFGFLSLMKGIDRTIYYFAIPLSTIMSEVLYVALGVIFCNVLMKVVSAMKLQSVFFHYVTGIVFLLVVCGGESRSWTPAIQAVQFGVILLILGGVYISESFVFSGLREYYDEMMKKEDAPFFYVFIQKYVGILLEFSQLLPIILQVRGIYCIFRLILALSLIFHGCDNSNIHLMK